MHLPRSRAALIAVGGLLLVLVALAGTLTVLNGSPSSTPSPSPTPTPSLTPAPSPTPTPSLTPAPSPTPTPSPTPKPEAVCPMNGTPIRDPDFAERVPLLVQIENNPIARPPSGLNRADLVIEAPVEGDTTRFSAIFMCRRQVDAAVGPVRSMRYFNLDYWQQMRVLTFNFGGAGRVLNTLSANRMPYINGITGQFPFFFRAGVWGAPHNVFFDVDEARAQIAKGGTVGLAAKRAGKVRAPFAFADDPKMPDGRRVDSIGLSTSSFWHFGWSWDRKEEAWLRTDGGAPNFDAVTGTRISARTVIVQVVRQTVLVGENDPGGYPRRYQYLTGRGEGVLYVNGRGYDVRWSRASADRRTKWTYARSGDPVVLPPGRIWWEIVPVGSGIREG